MAPADGDRCLQVPNTREWQVRVSGAQGSVWWLGRASMDVSVLQHVGCGTGACPLWLRSKVMKATRGCSASPSLCWELPCWTVMSWELWG